MAEHRARGLPVGKSGRSRATAWAVLLVGMTLTLPAAPAAAQATGGPGDIPAVGQYIERIPSAGRPAAGVARGKALPKKVRDRLRSRPDATSRELEALATDPSLGAPVDGGSPTRPAPSGAGKAVKGSSEPSAAAPPASAPGTPAAISSADPGTISSTGLGNPVLILGLLAVLTVAALVARHASRRKASGG